MKLMRVSAAASALEAGVPPAVLLPGTKWLYVENGREFSKGGEIGNGLRRYIIAVGDHRILQKPNRVVVFVKRVEDGARMEFLQEDLSVLPVRYDGQGERRRPFPSRCRR